MGHTKNDHDCRKNYKGSAKSMESDMALELFTKNKLFNKENVAVNVLVGDDDSSAIASVRRESLHSIEKWSDFNHTHKSFTSSLYALKLPKHLINYFSKNFAISVKKNKGDATKIESALQAVVPHAFGEHMLCSDWCKTASDPEYKHQNLPNGQALSNPELRLKLNQLFSRFIKNSKKIAECASTQANESLNNIIASKNPKSRHYGSSESLNYRIGASICQYNIGTKYSALVFSKMGYTFSTETLKFRTIKDEIRQKKGVQSKTIVKKKRRFQLKKFRSSDNATLDRREGITYESSVALNEISELPLKTIKALDDSTNLNNCRIIIYDLETSGFSKSDEILQIAACASWNESLYNFYVIPSKTISKSASDATGLQAISGDLYLHGSRVEAISAKTAVFGFINYLKSFGCPIVLLAHNGFKESGAVGRGAQHHHHQPQHQTSTQERRKLLKRTRSLAVISEDESRLVAAASGIVASCDVRLGSSCDSPPFDSSSLRCRRPQLIPRAKLIDRHSLKDRLSKSQQHLTDRYDRFSVTLPAWSSSSLSRPCHSRSLCGLHSQPPEPGAFGSLPLAEPAARGSGLPRRRRPCGARPRPPDGRLPLDAIEWPGRKPVRRYRSVQDLNSVSGLVHVVEDNFWPAEENRSIDCIYTQVKRKRKEHRSLESILFEDDSDDLEYFDILNLLPLSNVRLEVSDSEATNNSSIQRKDRTELANLEAKSNLTNSFSEKTTSGNVDKYSGQYLPTVITQNNKVPIKIDNQKKNLKNHKNSDPVGRTSKDFEASKEITSFTEIAREKRHCGSIFYAYENLNLCKDKDKPQIQAIVESCHSKSKKHVFDNEKNHKYKQKEKNIQLHEETNQCKDDKVSVEETEDIKSLWISDNEEAEEMSRRPQVLKVIDNDITKTKHPKKIISADVKSENNDMLFKKSSSENLVPNYQTYNVSNKPDLINDHVCNSNINIDNTEFNEEKERMSVENARNFFEKKSTNNEPLKETLTNCHSEGRFERIVKETSNIIGKACSAVKGSLGFEARSDSSDLGLGSEVGSDIRRSSLDDNTNVTEESNSEQNTSNELSPEFNSLTQKSCTNLTRSRSCMDSIECQDCDEPEFDHVRYKIVKSNMFSKNIFTNSKKDVTYDGLMQYLREYSFQDLLVDNNVVIIEPVRAEIERKPSFNDTKHKLFPICKAKTNSLEMIRSKDLNRLDKNCENKNESHFIKTPRQSSLRKHFFYQPIRVNRELNDDELPNPDTVRNVRQMFEETMKQKLKAESELSKDSIRRKSISMKDLRTLENKPLECESNTTVELSRSRCSSRAKNLTNLFENFDKRSSPSPINGYKDDLEGARIESKARAIAQSFEARSGQTSPSNSNSSKTKVNRYRQRQYHNWDAGSVSSGVSSDYPDTDGGSAPPCTSSEDEELYYQDDDDAAEPYEGHYVSQDVLKKIREYGTSVTYYGGKVVNISNGPLLSPMVCKKSNRPKNSLDYIKFRLVKSNSCDSRLELTGRVMDNHNKFHLNRNQGKGKGIDLRQFTIDEAPSIEITPIECKEVEQISERIETKEEKREPPVVIGLEPKKDESKTFKADFKLGKLDNSSINRFAPTALTRWQINENTWKRNSDFGKMEFEEFEVLEDSLNGTDN